MKKIIVASICFFTLITSLLLPVTTKAVTKDNTDSYTTIDPKKDPGYGSAHEEAAWDTKMTAEYGSRNAQSAYTGGGYIHDTRFDSMTITNGIDVSSNNKSIDWEKVKADGIDFAFIRVAVRYSSDGTLAADANYKENITEALNAGVKVGVYMFSQAINQEEAKQEANYVLKLISGYKITMPVVIDTEFDKYKAGRLYKAQLSKEQQTANVNAFAAVISNSGYTPMVYASKNFYENNMNAYDLTPAVWLAQFNTQTSYTGDYITWQYSSNGAVDGISTNVDVDYWYGDLGNVSYPYTGYANGLNYQAVFDPSYYASRYPDVAAAVGNNPKALFEHFINYGMKEGRQGNSEFQVAIYKENYYDLEQSFGNDLKLYYQHYIQFGQTEKRNGTQIINPNMYQGVDYSAVYDYDTYIKENPDIATAFQKDEYKTIQHFVTYGMSEGRLAKDSFDVRAYRAKYEDLRESFGNDYKKYYLHYINLGQKENRVATGSETITDGITVYQGIDYSDVYNYSTYIQNNPDIATAFSNDDIAALKHFVTFGMAEGRNAGANFNLAVYKANNPDLVAAYGNDNAKYYEHYMMFGKKEGRIAK